MNVRCPNCAQCFEAPDGIAGRKARCGACKTVFVVPAPGVETTRPCPNCGAVLAADAILCAKCGLNLEMGTASRRYWPEEEVHHQEEAPPSFAIKAVLFVGEWLPGLFRPKVLICSILCAIFGFATMGFCIAMMALGAMFAAFTIGAFGLIVYAQAIAMALTGEIAMLSDALTELNGAKWMLFFVILLAPILGFFEAFGRRFLG